jgi:predicted O-methyltransferase YrrM
MITTEEVESVPGWLDAIQGVELYQIASQLPPKSTIVEIGSYMGRSTNCLAQGLIDGHGGRVVAIDTFTSLATNPELNGISTLEEFTKNMKVRGLLGVIEILQGYSSQFVGKISMIDFLFIDGDHSKNACDFDYLNYSPNIVAGGYLALHDVGDGLGPKWVVDNRVIPSNQYEFIKQVNSMWIGRKK